MIEPLKMKASFGMIGKAISIVLYSTFIYFYVSLEDLFYSDVACGCSSACIGFYPPLSSRILGIAIIVFSSTVFVLSLWRFKGLSMYLALPALGLFLIAFYGNGFMIYDKGPCGASLNMRRFFIHETALGEYAKQDRETIQIDSLNMGKLNGKLLGFRIEDNELTLFRIGASPLKIKTEFLFWKIRTNVLVNHLSYGLSTFRNNENEKEGQYEFIGGKEMKAEDFIKDIVNQKLFPNEIKNAKVIEMPDGCSHFTFHLN